MRSFIKLFFATVAFASAATLSAQTSSGNDYQRAAHKADSLNAAFRKEYKTALQASDWHSASRLDLKEIKKGEMACCTNEPKPKARQEDCGKCAGNKAASAENRAATIRQTHIKNLQRLDAEITEAEGAMLKAAPRKATESRATLSSDKAKAKQQMRQARIKMIEARCEMMVSESKMQAARMEHFTATKALGKYREGADDSPECCVDKVRYKVLKQSKRQKIRSKRFYDKAVKKHGLTHHKRNDNQEVLSKPAEDIAVDAILAKVDAYAAKGTREDLNWGLRLLDAAINCYPGNNKLLEKKKSLSYQMEVPKF